MRTLISSFAILLASTLPAGEFNEAKSYLDPAPAWKELPGVDGETHSLANLKDKPVVVVAFTCNSCPYAVDYEDRLIALANKHDNVAVVAINVNLVKADKLEAMQQRATEKKFPFPYLFDESQEIAREYGASRTPEFFVLNKERKIIYMGSFDDNTDANEVTKHYVKDAIQAALTGERPSVIETAPIGCSIRYLSERQRERLRRKKEG